MRRTLGRAALAVGVLVASFGTLTGAASATAITPATARAGKLTQVGPIAEHGFPAWYRDSNNVRLEACTTYDDPYCLAPAGAAPNPDAPITFPNNFPDEFFYQLADASLTLSNGVKATVGMDLEGAFANGGPAPGDQMAFGRVRVRFAANGGERFRIIHPYGIDDVVADPKKGVFVTEDVGAAAGAFGQALNSRIGPFLKWDPTVAPAAPAGHIGDPAVAHAIVGSPYGTNFVQIEQLDPATGAVIGQLGLTNQFSVQGRYATNAGVDLDQANYTRDAAGNGVLEVFASSEPGQAIQALGNPALGFRTTSLRGDGAGHYYGRFPITGSAPAGTVVDVVNASDNPVAHKTKAMTDVVSIGQVRYDADAGKLSVPASSSDVQGSPALTVTGLGPVANSPFTGVFAPPATITVTSAAGGSSTVPLTGTGAAFLPAAPAAAADAQPTATIGQTVRLDGTASIGVIDSYAWTQTAGPAVTLTGATTATPTFTAPAAGTYTFSLTVTGPGGTSAPATVTVQVSAAAAPNANAGTNQVVQRGKVVTLDGSTSTGAGTYLWNQVSGPAVALTGATTAKPSFTYPLQALPATPGPNATFAVDRPVVLGLTVTNAAGSSFSTVTINPLADPFTALTARYRTGNNEWRIAGNTTLIAGQRVEAVLGSTLNGVVIGTPVQADGTGAFAIRVTGPVPGNIRTISLVSGTGGVQLAFPVTVTN